jgi:hypothetical protein
MLLKFIGWILLMDFFFKHFDNYPVVVGIALVFYLIANIAESFPTLTRMGE